MKIEKKLNHTRKLILKITAVFDARCFNLFNFWCTSRSYLLVVEITVRHLPLRSVLVFFIYTGAGVANMLYNDLAGT